MRLAAALAAGALALACGNSFAPSVDNMAGDYHVTAFTTTDTLGTTVNWVAIGATMTLSLKTNDSVTGHIFVPGGAPGGGDLDADMAGTWVLTGDIITFNQAADTFVRNVAFIASKNRLSGDQQFSSNRIRITLTK